MTVAVDPGTGRRPQPERRSILVGILFFLQGFGLGGVIATFGLVLDGVGFVLFLIFVLVSSVTLLRRDNGVPDTAGRTFPS